MNQKTDYDRGRRTMINRQVITVTPTGGLEGLQRKPEQGVDLRQFGHAEIERASLVEWDEKKQAWYIDVLQEPGLGVLSGRKLKDADAAYWNRLDLEIPSYILPGAPDYGNFEDWDAPLLFSEYDDAVKVEIAYLDAMRLKGLR